MRDKNAVLAGGFIIVAVLLIAGVIVAVKGAASFFESTRTYLVRFDVADDVGGLRSGSEVRVGGLKVGAVNTIRFDADGDPPSVLATFTLPERIPLGEGAEVAVQSTITGVSWLNVDALGDVESPLDPDTAIDGDPNTLTQLLASATELVPEVTGTFQDVRGNTIPKVNAAVDEFGTLASETNEQIARTIEPIRSAADDASALARSLNEDLPPAVAEGRRLAEAGADTAEALRVALADDEDGQGNGAGDLRQTLENVEAATATVKDRLPGTMDRLDSALDKTGDQLDKVAAMLDDLRGTASQVSELIADNRPRIDRILGNVRQASDTFRLATAEIRRSPWRLLYRPDKSESEQLDLYDAARRFAEGAQELSAAADELRAAADAGNDERTGKLLTRVEAKLDEFNAAERALYERLR